MKGLAFLLMGLASVAMADEQFYGFPLRIEGECISSRNNQTTYLIRLTNFTKQPVNDLRITSAGIRIHHRQYSPPLYVKQIAPKSTYTLRFTVRGQIYPEPDYREYGIESQFYFQRNKHQSVFPGPCIKTN